MIDAVTRSTIKEDPGACQTEKDGHPVPPTTTEAEPTQNLQKERPADGVESFREVDLQEDTAPLP